MSIIAIYFRSVTLSKFWLHCSAAIHSQDWEKRTGLVAAPLHHYLNMSELISYGMVCSLNLSHKWNRFSHKEVCEADTHSTKCTFTRLSLYQLTATTNYFEHVRCVTANNNYLKAFKVVYITSLYIT